MIRRHKAQVAAIEGIIPIVTHQEIAPRRHNQFPVLNVFQEHPLPVGFQREIRRIGWELVAIIIHGTGQMLDVRFLDWFAIAD